MAATTLTQLLSHSAGMIRDGVHGDQFLDRRPFANEKELRAALAKPLTIEASTRFKYSNHAFGLVGLVIEAVTGEPYRDWIAREIVAPSGLGETTPDAPAPRGAPLAAGHTRALPLGQRLVVPGDNPTYAIGAAGGFVSTAADLSRFFASLDPAAKRSVLSPASRREMIRKQWHNPHGSIRGRYGLGIMQGKAGAWEWFGHAGGFQSCISRTIVLPGRDICVSILVNAVDGPAWSWSDAVIHILQTFEKRGAPSARTRDWAGRWWSLWRTIDLVPMRDRVLVDDPGLAVPFSDASEIAVTGDDTGTIRFAPGIANFGEDARLVRGKDGRVREVLLAGTKYLPERRLTSGAQAPLWRLVSRFLKFNSHAVGLVSDPSNRASLTHRHARGWTPPLMQAFSLARFVNRMHDVRLVPDSLGRSGRWITSGFGTGSRMSMS